MTGEGRILIVGGRSRIGGAVASRFLRHGWVVETTTRRPADGEALAAALGGDHVDGRIEAAELDLADEDSIRRFVDARRETSLDAVVVAASPFEEMSLADATMEDYRRHAVAQVAGPSILLAGLSAALRRSRRPAGAGVVLFGDVHAAARPRPGATPYLASKAAVEGLVGILARELAPIRVFGVSPGLVGEVHAWSDEAIEKYVERLPLPRTGTCEDAARMVAAIIDEFRYATGVVIPLDGGRHLV